jgi:beta-glucosidase
MSLKVGNVNLNYVEKNEEGGYENTSREIPAGQGVMTAFNRIGYTWTGGSYPLITGVLRNEWGFNGFIITDNANTGEFMDAYQMIEAGADGKLTSIPEGARYTFDESNVAEYHYGREAMHHMLYTIANSNVMNGAMPGSDFKQGMQKAQMFQIAINVICGGLILLMVFFTYRRFRKKGKNEVGE